MQDDGQDDGQGRAAMARVPDRRSLLRRLIGVAALGLLAPVLLAPVLAVRAAQAAPPGRGRWVCTKQECEPYIYDPAVGDPDGGIAPGTRFEDIPDTWTCPVCGASKQRFRRED